MNIFHIPICHTEAWLLSQLNRVGAIQTSHSKCEAKCKYSAVVVFKDKESIQRVPDYIKNILLHEGNLSAYFGVNAVGTFATWVKETQPHPLSLVDRSVYIGNLHERVTEADLLDLCLEAGPVESIILSSKSWSRKKQPPAFAFVVFKHSFIVPYALTRLHGIAMYGRNICVAPKRSGIWECGFV